MNRRQFLKGGLLATGGAFVALNGLGTFLKMGSHPLMAAGESKLVFSSCEMCRNQCPVAVKVQDGKVVKVDGNPNDSAFGGVICARGQSAPTLLYDPQRLKKPMIRTGERGDGKFKEVSWNEAYQYIADKLKDVQTKYGSESVVFTSRKGPHDVFFRTIAAGIGSPNTFSHESTCPLTRSFALESTFGTSAMGADYGNTKYLISIGRNWFEGIHVAQTRAVMKAVSNGAKLVVLDPRFSVAASKGEWLPVKGASDLAFVMAMANVMIAENLYDKDFIARYTEGFDKWADAVKDKTPAWAEKETGIAKDTIVRITREFAKAKPHAMIDYGWRTALTPNDHQLRRAIMIVNMMNGAFEVPGGYFVNKSAPLLKKFPAQAGYAQILGSVKTPPFPKPAKGRIDGAGVKGTPGQLIIAADGAIDKIPEAILNGQPYPVKAWMVHRFNPVISMPESERVLAAIKKLDLIVTCDLYMTDTAYYSDVVLPECTYLERYEQVYDMSGLTPKYVLRQPAVPLVYPDTKPGWQIYKELGEKMGLGQYFPFRDMEEYLNRQLAPAGLTLTQLKEKGVWTPPGMKPFYVRGTDPAAPIDNILNTATKKINIFSEEIEEITNQGVPEYEQHPQPTEGKFRFLQGKAAVHTNAGTHNVPVLNELMPTNTLWINAASAGKLGIKDGDDIIISNGKYDHKGKAKVTEGIRPDSVFCYHGFGRISPELKRAYGKGINDNKLVLSGIGVVGNTLESMAFVSVKKA